MTLSYNDPWAILNRWQEEIQRLRQSPVARGGEADGSNIATSRWSPAVDILEEDHRFVLLADIPGVSPEEIEITMDNGVLTLKGERKETAPANPDGAKRIERVSGAFHRRFALPDGVDAEKVAAHGRNGVLEVSIPKVERAKQRRIEVRS